MGILRLSVAMALTAVIPSMAFGQARDDRPYRGLFGGGYGTAEQLLALNVSFGAGYDGNVLVGQSGVPNPTAADSRRSTASTIGDASGNLSYHVSRSAVTLSVFGAASAAYYPSLPKPLYSSYSGGGGGSFRLTSRSNFSFDTAAAYLPLSFLPSLPALADNSALVANKAFLSKLSQSFTEQFGEPPDLGLTPVTVPDEDAGFQFQNHALLSGTVGFSYRLTRHLSLGLSAAVLRSASASGGPDLFTQSEAGSLSYTLTKGIALRAGYGYSVAHFGAGSQLDAIRSHNVDGGLDFNRALSVSRRLRLTFGTGSSVLDDGRQTRYFLTGHAELIREIGRSWSAALTYNRGVAFLEAFRKPVLSDSLGVNLGGLVTRAVQFHSNAGLSRGAVGLTSVGNTYTAYFGTLGMNFAFTRTLALGVDYSYYRYSFDSGVVLPVGLSHRVNRQSIRASLNLWEALFHRTRRPDAAR